MTRLAAGVAALLLVVTAASARAQRLIPGPLDTPTASQVTEARALYQAGNAAAESGQFADALQQFVQAYGLSGNPAALYNAAKTLRSLGRHVEARDAFNQLLAQHPDVSDTTRAEATALRDGEAARIAVLTVLDLPDAMPGLVLHLDGTVRRDEGERPLVLELDPGNHGLLVERERFQPFSWQGMLSDGARESVRVALRPVVVSRSIFEDPLFWIVTGAVIVVGVAIVTAIVLQDSAQLRPEQGPSQTIRL